MKSINFYGLLRALYPWFGCGRIYRACFKLKHIKSEKEREKLVGFSVFAALTTSHDFLFYSRARSHCDVGYQRIFVATAMFPLFSFSAHHCSWFGCGFWRNLHILMDQVQSGLAAVSCRDQSPALISLFEAISRSATENSRAFKAWVKPFNALYYLIWLLKIMYKKPCNKFIIFTTRALRALKIVDICTHVWQSIFFSEKPPHKHSKPFNHRTTFQASLSCLIPIQMFVEQLLGPEKANVCCEGNWIRH